MPKIPFHLVTRSPWPILTSFQLFNTMYWTAKNFNTAPWHTKKVILGLKLGMLLFITSEVFFFLSFFWAFFHSSLSPDIFIGQNWPCKGIKSFNPMGIPLMNTMILLSSGVTLTSAHHFLMMGSKNKCNSMLLITIFLGVYFTFLQFIEYKETSFTIADSIYGSTFFMATGFHGIHVLIGTIFLLICFIRPMKNHFSLYHHFGFEAAAWYWHFVDVVWLFLYLFIYWLGK